MEKESEFSKYGMAMRVFKYFKRYTYNQDDWCTPKAVFEIVLIEFDRLVHGEVAIPNFKFHDEYEREFLARVVTRGFLSGGLLREREMVLCERWCLQQRYAIVDVSLAVSAMTSVAAPDEKCTSL